MTFTSAQNSLNFMVKTFVFSSLANQIVILEQTTCVHLNERGLFKLHGKIKAYYLINYFQET